MRVKLTNLRYKEKELDDQITELCSVIRHNLNPLIHKVPEMNVPEAAGQMDDLVMAYAELQGVLSEISKLERELDG
jgi:hypothetical protein